MPLFLVEGCYCVCIVETWVFPVTMRASLEEGRRWGVVYCVAHPCGGGTNSLSLKKHTQHHNYGVGMGVDEGGGETHNKTIMGWGGGD